jgi:hypothetical protein
MQGADFSPLPDGNARGFTDASGVKLTSISRGSVTVTDSYTLPDRLSDRKESPPEPPREALRFVRIEVRARVRGVCHQWHRVHRGRTGPSLVLLSHHPPDVVSGRGGQ